MRPDSAMGGGPHKAVQLLNKAAQAGKGRTQVHPRALCRIKSGLLQTQ